MNKYQHDTERFLRSQSKIYALRGNLQMARNYELCADDVKKLKVAVDLGEQGAGHMRDEVARLKGGLTALKESFAPLVLACEEADNSEELCENVEGQLICNARAALDALAALVGEEGK